jgi:hypothetical protein
MKFRAIEVSMKRMPTPLSRLLTAAVGLRVDDPVIDRCPKQVKQMQEDNHQPRQEEENQRRMGNLVSDLFYDIEQLLQKRLVFFFRFVY